jgi:hypothetical protein
MPSPVAKKKKGEKKKLPTVKCLCGVEILLVPDVKIMSKALEAHVEEHKRRIKNAKEAEVEAQCIMDDLIEKVLSKACGE